MPPMPLIALLFQQLKSTWKNYCKIWQILFVLISFHYNLLNNVIKYFMVSSHTVCIHQNMLQQFFLNGRLK